jgi:hypothetical protein
MVSPAPHFQVSRKGSHTSNNQHNNSACFSNSNIYLQSTNDTQCSMVLLYLLHLSEHNYTGSDSNGFKCYPVTRENLNRCQESIETLDYFYVFSGLKELANSVQDNVTICAIW